MRKLRLACSCRTVEPQDCRYRFLSIHRSCSVNVSKAVAKSAVELWLSSHQLVERSVFLYGFAHLRLFSSHDLFAELVETAVGYLLVEVLSAVGCGFSDARFHDLQVRSALDVHGINYCLHALLGLQLEASL